MVSKVCKKCGIEKQFDQFVKNKNCKNGVTSECNSCARDRKRKDYKKYNDNRDKELLNKWRNQNTKDLGDSYINQLFRQGRFKKPTEEMIELRRLNIKLKRYVKQYEQRLEREGTNGDYSQPTPSTHLNGH
jgi:hypothetical protein